MSEPRTMRQWLDEYGESHTNATNELIHWICVPVIFFCVIGLLAALPPQVLPFIGHYPWAKLAIVLTLGFYFERSKRLFVGMAIWCLICLFAVMVIDRRVQWPLWAVCTTLFAAAWIGQFIGHRIEGKKPSFLKDLQFLLIGPAWLMEKIYRRFGVAV